MRILRDFYKDLSPLDRAVFWLTIGLCLAIGFLGKRLDDWREIPRDESFTAPPFEMRTAAGRT